MGFVDIRSRVQQLPPALKPKTGAHSSAGVSHGAELLGTMKWHLEPYGWHYVPACSDERHAQSRAVADIAALQLWAGNDLESAVARAVRVQWNRIRRCPLAGLRNPQAERLTCLTSLLVPSVQAFVTPLARNASAAISASITGSRRSWPSST